MKICYNLKIDILFDVYKPNLVWMQYHINTKKDIKILMNESFQCYIRLLPKSDRKLELYCIHFDFTYNLKIIIINIRGYKNEFGSFLTQLATMI